MVSRKTIRLVHNLENKAFIFSSKCGVPICVTMILMQLLKLCKLVRKTKFGNEQMTRLRNEFLDLKCKKAKTK